jgi:hypothetical protein
MSLFSSLGGQGDVWSMSGISFAWYVFQWANFCDFITAQFN